MSKHHPRVRTGRALHDEIAGEIIAELEAGRWTPGAITGNCRGEGGAGDPNNAARPDVFGREGRWSYRAFCRPHAEIRGQAAGRSHVTGALP